MNCKEAQNIAERFCNNPKDNNITIAEIRSALVILANFYEDYKKKSCGRCDSWDGIAYKADCTFIYCPECGIEL